MAFELRSISRQKVRRGVSNDDNPLVYELIVDGAKVTPTSATITIYRNGVSAAVLSSTAMTVSGSKLTYSVSTVTTATWPVDSYRADIVVTYNSKTYERQVMFDVVPYLFDVNIGFDELVSLDDGIRGMNHDSDPLFKPMIIACQDILKAMLEAKVVDDKKVMQEMLIDHSALAVAFRFYILHRIWFNKGDSDRAQAYRRDFNELWDAVLSTIRYDKGLSGSEPASMGVLTEVRFMT